MRTGRCIQRQHQDMMSPLLCDIPLLLRTHQHTQHLPLSSTAYTLGAAFDGNFKILGCRHNSATYLTLDADDAANSPPPLRHAPVILRTPFQFNLLCDEYTNSKLVCKHVSDSDATKMYRFLTKISMCIVAACNTHSTNYYYRLNATPNYYYRQHSH